MEKQLIFDYAKEQNLLDGKTCNTCENCDTEEGVCTLDMSEVNGDHSCGDYVANNDQGMSEIAEDARAEFHSICDEYQIPDNVRSEIYRHCKWF